VAPYEVGEQWAYRERPRTMGGPVTSVEVLQHGPPRSRKVRVRWLDGEFAGLDEWVSGARLIARWDGIEPLLEDERCDLELEAAQPDPFDQNVAAAIQEVGLAIESPVWFEIHRGAVRVQIDDFNSVADEVPMPPQELLSSPGAYVDREGALHLGQAISLDLAQRFCQQQADRILTRGRDSIERIRRAVITGVYEPCYERIEPWHIATAKAEAWLIEAETTWRTVRAWCGTEAEDAFDERQALHTEVARLQRLVQDTARWLRDAGHPVKAAAVLRQLRAANA
jgi:hypothetical protein